MDLSIHIESNVWNCEDGVWQIKPKQKANSLVGNFMRILMAQFNNATTSGKCIDISNTERSLGSSSYVHFIGGNATTNYGPVIGTGTTAVTLDDYKLETQVTTNWFYTNTTIGLATADDFFGVKITRSFVNWTGDSVDINEVGLYGYHPSGWYFMVERTLYDVTIPNNNGTTITYTIGITL